MITSSLLIFSSLIFAVIGWALGSAMGYSRGFDDGWDQAESFASADDLADLRWQLSATPSPAAESPALPAVPI